MPFPGDYDVVAAVIQRRASGKENTGKEGHLALLSFPRADCLPCWFDATELYFSGETSLQ